MSRFTRLARGVLVSTVPLLVLSACSAESAADGERRQGTCDSLGCGGEAPVRTGESVRTTPATNAPDCDSVPASVVTPASSATWAEAIWSTQGKSVPALVQWANELSAHGCTNPELVSFMNEGGLGKVWVTTCPADVGTTVADVENLTWAEMTLTCNRAVPVAPAGFVNYGWFFGTPLIPRHPTAPPVRGCSLGECASAPSRQ